ncbi:unnamed protein product [Symbiodinium natans]|uniref:Uncharacterized protein n=1 Tax=Symbiodinium natans TaxID=878477 RepID=A0A812L1M6_9DINO|nr:unnamed protein product [Symbiodinium natans]
MALEAGLETAASQAAQRSIRSFATRWQTLPGANATEADPLLQQMEDEVNDLHKQVSLLSSKKLSRAEEVRQTALRTAAYTNKLYMKKAKVLGMYQQTAAAKKMEQRVLMDSVGELASNSSTEHESLRNAQKALRFFDSTWWQVRRHLDDYLQAVFVVETEVATSLLAVER